MDNYLRNFLKVIRSCHVDNTYKMAWARALVEVSSYDQNNYKVDLSQIAELMFKYYWDQTIYFDLIQGSNLAKPPEMLTEVKKVLHRILTKRKHGSRFVLLLRKSILI